MKFINKISLFFLCVMAWNACSPYEESRPSLGDQITEDQISFAIDDSDPNQPVFTNTSATGFKAIWDLGNGTSAAGETAQGMYPSKGDYDITLKVISAGGEAQKTIVYNVPKDDPSLLDREDYNFLTGGGSALNGKNWKWDHTMPAHMGIGPPDGTTPEWWAASPDQKAGLGAYDDVLNFSIFGFAFDLENNGDTYVKDYMKDEFLSMGGTIVQEDDDITFDIDLNTEGWGWAISDRDGKKFLTFTNGAFPSWHVGGNQEFEVMLLTEDELQLRTIGQDGNAWYMNFIREGFEHPEVPEVEKPLEANDIFDDFDGNSNIAWILETEEFATYDNPRPAGINTSPKVAKYTRTGDNEWANVQFELAYRMDLSTRNTFKLKVLLPDYNDYESENGGTIGGKLQKVVALKLQDSKHPSPWETQVEIVQTVADEDLGKWVELTFDFSSVKEATNFDKVVLQFGSEGHKNSGIFFLDDFKLL
ncbi:PKD domain-containing protein [Persicobacter psychrovividus]|uniref:PKD domain-containing protein n=1 Tax=Persicobacter psychrovividus TaxID=387638 RepID=A0ABN6LGL2_9BACT|nr:hypothetical protein PEPS_45220 [Persicobacter psychrovividus]